MKFKDERPLAMPEGRWHRCPSDSKIAFLQWLPDLQRRVVKLEWGKKGREWK
jgi:hypothetical protein